jgi:hypothetical protein
MIKWLFHYIFGCYFGHNWKVDRAEQGHLLHSNYVLGQGNQQKKVDYVFRIYKCSRCKARRGEKEDIDGRVGKMPVEMAENEFANIEARKKKDK